MEELLARAGRAAETELDVEVELVRERADALGRAGRALEHALAAYRSATAASVGSLPPDEDARLIASITASLYRLVLQRECSGARAGNLAAVRAAYDIPEAALRRL